MQDNNTQPAVVTKAINKAIELLKASGAKFKVISPNGTEFGELEIAPEKKKHFKYEYGALKAVFIEYLKDLKEAEVAQIKVPDSIDVEDVRSSACAWMATNWGAGTYTTTVDRDFNVVEVLRVK